MCKELEKQMSEMLKGSKPTITTKAITILAMDIDKKFANVDNKLDNILVLLKENKIDTDSKIKELRDSQIKTCSEHKDELKKKFNELDKDVETLNFFTKHPNILKFIGVVILFLIGIIIGKLDLWEVIKLIK